MTNEPTKELVVTDLTPGAGVLTMLAIAILGGLAKQAHQWLNGKQPTFKHFIFRAIISVFIGIICYYSFPKDSAWTYAATGLLSWLGADGISLLIQIVVKPSKRGGKHDR